MTHVTVDYSTLADGEREVKALTDCREWLGEEKFEEVMELLNTSLKQGAKEEFLVTTLNMLSGIQGYPAIVMVRVARRH